MIKLFKSLLCKVIGHKMYALVDIELVGGIESESHCSRCDYKTPRTVWPTHNKVGNLDAINERS